MRTHILKLQKDFCDAVYIGEKEFELRYNDRGFQKGDRVRFVPMDGEVEYEHPLSEEIYEITYVLAGWGLQRNYVAFGIRNIDAAPSHARTKPERLVQNLKEILDTADEADIPHRAMACVTNLMRQIGYGDAADIFAEIIREALNKGEQP